MGRRDRRGTLPTRSSPSYVASWLSETGAPATSRPRSRPRATWGASPAQSSTCTRRCTDGFNHVARAVEIELRDELVDPLERLVAARKLKRLDDAIADARGTGARGERKSWTMGSIVGFVQSFATHHRRDLEALGLG